MEKVVSKQLDLPKPPEPPKYPTLHAVKAAYVHGEIDYLELDERTMEALKWERQIQDDPDPGRLSPPRDPSNRSIPRRGRSHGMR